MFNEASASCSGAFTEPAVQLGQVHQIIQNKTDFSATCHHYLNMWYKASTWFKNSPGVTSKLRRWYVLFKMCGLKRELQKKNNNKKKKAPAASKIKDKIIYHLICHAWWVCYRLEWGQVCSRRTDRSCGPLLRPAPSLIYICAHNANCEENRL